MGNSCIYQSEGSQNKSSVFNGKSKPKAGEPGEINGQHKSKLPYYDQGKIHNEQKQIPKNITASKLGESPIKENNKQEFNQMERINQPRDTQLSLRKGQETEQYFNQGGEPYKRTIKEADKLFTYLIESKSYFNFNLWNRFTRATFNTFSIIKQESSEGIKLRNWVKNILRKKNSLNSYNFQEQDKRISRAVGCFLGLAICDALGASTEFNHFNKQGEVMFHDFEQLRMQIKQKKLKPRHGEIGIWTDDCSMALCIGDSLLLNNFKFDPKHIRFLFHMWLYHGLNNGGRRYSIGLGANIKMSMDEFCVKQTDYMSKGDGFINGNGSLMRLAPIPVCFWREEEMCLKYAEKQSMTTHNGEEAKWCSRLLALILCRLIKRESDEEWRYVLTEACFDFAKSQDQYSTVKYLAESRREPNKLFNYQKQMHGDKFLQFNQSVADRDWDWKSPDFTYSPRRTKENPGYVGSYCMDALAMSLHTIWFGRSFEEVAARNANMGGDCDTVGAIAGQIAGAIYGVDFAMLSLYGQMEDARNQRYEVFIKAYKLATNSPLQYK